MPDLTIGAYYSTTRGWVAFVHGGDPDPWERSGCWDAPDALAAATTQRDFMERVAAVGLEGVREEQRRYDEALRWFGCDAEERGASYTGFMADCEAGTI